METITLPASVPPYPTILFTFDDGYSDTYTKAYAYLHSKNMVGTMYIPTSQIGEASHCSAAQCQEMDANGFLVANHTVTHPYPGLSSLTLAQQEAELDNARIALEAIGCTAGARHVAYPSGQYNAETLAAMANTGMLTGRGTGWGFTTVPLAAPPYELTCAVELGLPSTLAAAKAALDRFIVLRQPGIVLLHKIVDIPTDGTMWATSDFQALVDYALALGIKSLTMDELYRFDSVTITHD